jgi:outer membrane protein assembly factor BamB
MTTDGITTTPTGTMYAHPATAPVAAIPVHPPRLWPGLVLVALFWAALVVVAHLDKPYFVGFMYSMASPAVLLLLFSIWWWFNRRLSLADRAAGCLLVIATGAAVAPLCHRSIWFALPTQGLPVALTVLTLWMLVVHWTGFAWKTLGLLAVLALSWGYFTLIRMDGVDGDLHTTIRWRWEPTPEEVFLKERAREARARSSAPRPSSPSSLSLSAGDWPAFRGPDRDGVIPGVRITTDWKTTPPKLLWRRRVGPAWSSVIVIGDRLFTQEQRGDEETVVCYEAATGKEVWARGDAVRFWEAVSGAGPRATPTFAAGRLFTMGATGRLTCRDAATGEHLWSHDVAAETPARPPRWGYSSSPLVVDDLVIAFAGGESERNLLAYRTDSGELAWTAPASHNSYSSPQLAMLGGRPHCLLLGDRGLTAVDPATGKALWQYGEVTEGEPRAMQPHVLGSSQLLVGNLNGTGVSLVDVKHDGDEWKVSETWSTSQMKPEFPDFVVHGGCAYGFDGAFFCCLDLASGDRRWKEGRYGHGQVMLLPEQSLLLVVAENGSVVLLAADPEQHREFGRIRALKEKTWNHPVIAHGRLYVRNDEEMACYELPGLQEK